MMGVTLQNMANSLLINKNCVRIEGDIWDFFV